MPTLLDHERRQYPRFPCAAPIRISLSGLFEDGITGECLEVCCNGLRIETLQAIPSPAQVTLRALGLGLTGKGVVKHCHTSGDKFIIGLEFTGGLHWEPPDETAAETALSESMTPRTAAIFQDLLGGASANALQPAVDQLSDEERDTLFCTAACIQSAVAATCRARADEIVGMLALNHLRSPVHLLPV